ncbi:MAG: hypothetical protein IJ722_03200 [Alloprevotella sp.]|nr:hypothetical protein [Alloprevotella sp.]MBR1933575.1 hypothetical protein [Prevotella sp.]
MNIYARFFDQETLVASVEELVMFLQSIPDIRVTDTLMEDIRAYVEGDMPYPKRYKVRPRVYFILIKTPAATMEEFKANRKKPAAPTESMPEAEMLNRKELKLALLAEQKHGWYRGQITFKRVLLIPGTGKFQYQDTDFEAYVLADSGTDCYNRIISHLRNRPDVDMRSQFPSARGTSYAFEFIGESLPEAITEEADNAPQEVLAE